MVFGIIGGGAIGMMYAARLALAGYKVRLWTRTQRQAELLNSEGLLYISGEKMRRAPVSAQAIASVPGRKQDECEADVLWLTVKQPHIDDQLLSCMNRITNPSTLVLCLQNGIGHMELLRDRIPGVPFAAAVTSEGAKREDERTVRSTGSGQLWIEALEDPSGKVVQLANKQKKLAETLQMAGIPAFLSKEMTNRIYHKLLVNSVINPLTALFGVRNGQLPEDPVRLSLMKALHEESLAVLTAAGMPGDGGDWDGVLAVCGNTASNYSSMLTDIRSGRKTEVDWINGGIIKLARQYGIPAPLNEAVTALIHAVRI
ncbi:ketopantoate reductase family protein [Paenibacillus tarimensis]